jgi:hypothetical protein
MGIPAGVAIAVGVEDYYGLGAAAGCAVKTDDGRILVWGELFLTREDAFSFAVSVTADRPGSLVRVGASVNHDALSAALSDGVNVERAGTAETRAALPTLRALLSAGRLIHDGTRALTTQLAGFRVTSSPSGGLSPVPHGTRSDLVRAVAWAAHDADHPATVPEFFVF